MSIHKHSAFSRMDDNHTHLTEMYEALHCSVVDTHELGFGFPDAVVGCGGLTALVEFKSTDGTLTPAQTRFVREWRGSKVQIIRSTDDVIAHVTQMRARFGSTILDQALALLHETQGASQVGVMEWKERVRRFLEGKGL